MQIHFHLTEDDYLHLLQHIMRQYRFFSWRYLIAVCKSGLFVFGFLMLAQLAGEGVIHQVNVLFAAFFLSWLWWIIWSRTSLQKQWLKQYSGAYSVTLTAAGIATTITNKRSYFHNWSDILACETTEHYIYLYLQSNIAIIIPRNCFESAEQEQILLARVQQFWQQAPDNNGRILASTPSSNNVLRPFFTTLIQVLRAALLLKFDLRTLRGSYRITLCLMLLNVICYGAFDYLDAHPQPSFNPEALLPMAGLFIFCLAAAAFISRFTSLRNSVLLLLQLILACQLITYVFAGFLYFSISPALAEEGATLFKPLLLAWRLLVMCRLLQQLYLLNGPTAMQFSAIYGAIIFIPAGILPASPFYYANDPIDENSHYNQAKQLDVEKIFYQQPQLVEQTLQQLKPQHPKQTDLYFVGFAGQAEEQVFSNEVQFAQNLLEKRFNAQSITLLNNRQAIDKTPLANTHNLANVLNGIGKRMDKKQDVLFLFLSSHGAKNHSLAVSFWPMKLNDLKAEQLKSMLDQSGIQNRVIVVSACYSGGFLDVLKNEHTLILTASSRDHVSYGCGDYTQYTYFGEAFFVNALSQQTSFIEAFSQARRQIETREKQENKSPSSPQIHIGKEIEAKLAQLKIHS